MWNGKDKQVLTVKCERQRRLESKKSHKKIKSNVSQMGRKKKKKMPIDSVCVGEWLSTRRMHTNDQIDDRADQSEQAKAGKEVMSERNAHTHDRIHLCMQNQPKTPAYTLKSHTVGKEIPSD